jgi:hypothetical protein
MRPSVWARRYQRDLLAQLEREETDGWTTVTGRSPAQPLEPDPEQIHTLRRILTHLYDVMREHDDTVLRPVMAANARRQWANTGQPKKAA